MTGLTIYPFISTCCIVRLCEAKMTGSLEVIHHVIKLFRKVKTVQSYWGDFDGLA